MVEVHPFSLGYLLSEYKRKFDKADLERILDNLVLHRYIVKINEYHSPDPKISQNLELIRSKNKNAYNKLVTTLMENGLLNISTNYGIPNVNEYQQIKRLFRKRRALNWLKGILLQILQFIWKHFVYIIVALIIAIITFYLTSSK